MSHVAWSLALFTLSAITVVMAVTRIFTHRGSVVENAYLGLVGFGFGLVSVSLGSLGPIANGAANIISWIGLLIAVAASISLARRSSVKTRDREEIR